MKRRQAACDDSRSSRTSKIAAGINGSRKKGKMINLESPERGNLGGGSKLSVPKHLVVWLRALGMVQGDNSGSLTSSERKLIRSGVLVAHLASSVLGCRELARTSNGNPDALETWENILRELAQFSLVNVASQDGAAAELVQGNGHILLRLLEELHNVHASLTIAQGAPDAMPSVALSVSATDLDLIREGQTDGSQARTAGMFLVQSISSKLAPGLGLEQAAALLSGANSNYLKQLLTAGPKGNLRGLYDFAHELYISRELLCELLIQALSVDDVTGFLRMLGVFLYSPDEVLVVKAWAILSELARRVTTEDSGDGPNLAFKTEAYVSAMWHFLRSAWGTGGLVRSWNKDACRPLVLDTLGALASAESVGEESRAAGSLSSLFRVELHEHLPNSTRYMQLCHDVVRAISIRSHNLGQELSRRDLPRYWCGVAGRLAEAQATIPCRQAALGLLAQVWTTFTKDIEQDPALPKSLLLILNKAFRNSNSLSLQIFGLGTVFDLLESFAAQHKPFAPYLYKTVIFSLIEFHKNAMVRDFIVSNLSRCLRNMPFAPVGVIITPLVKQISLHGFNNLDIEFLHSLARHQRMDARDAAQLMDLCAKIALNDMIFGRAAADLFVSLIKRFPFNHDIQQLVLRVFSTAAIMLERSGRRMERAHRAQIINVLTSVVALQITAINDQVAGTLEMRKSLKPVADQLEFLQRQRAMDAGTFSSTMQHHESQRHHHMQQQQQSFYRGATETTLLDSIEQEEREGEDLQGSQSAAPLFGDTAVPEDDEQDPEQYKSRMQQEHMQKMQKTHAEFKASKVGQQIEKIQSVVPPPKVSDKPATFKGLKKLCVELDPSDSGYINKVRFLGVVNSKEEGNAKTRMILECEESRIIKDRKLQDKVRRQSTKKPGHVFIEDIIKLFGEHLKAMYKAQNEAAKKRPADTLTHKGIDEPTSPSAKSPRRRSPPAVPKSVQNDIERIAQQRRDKQRDETRAEEKQRAQDQLRRQRMRKRFAARVEEKRQQERLIEREAKTMEKQNARSSLNAKRAIQRSATQQAVQQNRDLLDFEVAILKTFDPLLTMIFQFAGRTGASTRVSTFDELQKRRVTLPVQGWLSMMRAYSVIPGVASQEEVRACYFRSKGHGKGDISYEDFLYALAGIATRCTSFSYEPDATSRVFALMSYLRSAALTSLRLRKNADPTERRILLKWAKSKTIPSVRHTAPNNLEHGAEAVTVALGVLDELLSETFGVHLLIPQHDEGGDFAIKAGTEAILKADKRERKLKERPAAVAPKDTRLYPESKIAEQRQMKAKESKRPIVNGFGGHYEKPPTPKRVPRRKKRQDGEKPEPKPVKLSPTEQAFMERLEESMEKNGPRRVEKASVRRKREAAERAEKERAADEERRARREALAKRLEKQLIRKREVAAKKAAQELKEKEKEIQKQAAKDSAMKRQREARRAAIEAHKEAKRAKEIAEAKAKEKAEEKERSELRKRFQRIKAEHYEIADDADLLSSVQSTGQDKAFEREKRAILVKRQRELEMEKRRIAADKKEALAGKRLRERQRAYEEKLRARREKDAAKESAVAATLEKERKRIAAKQKLIEEESMAKLAASQQKIAEQKRRDEKKRQDTLARKAKVEKAALDFDATAKSELQDLAKGVHTPEPGTGRDERFSSEGISDSSLRSEPISPQAESEFTELIATESGTKMPAPVNAMFKEGQPKTDLMAVQENQQQEEKKDVEVELAGPKDISDQFPDQSQRALKNSRAEAEHCIDEEGKVVT